MGNKALWAIIAVLAVALVVAVFFLYPHPAAAPQAVSCTMEAKMCPDGTAVGRTGPQCEFAACPTPTFAWTFKDMGTDGGSGAPKTEVSLAMNGKVFPLGTYDGSCAEINGSSWKPVSGETTGVICWFAGGGTELGVFEENGKLVVKKGALDEGDAETAGTRGNFQLLLSLVP
jgi:hypothetical protein